MLGIDAKDSTSSLVSTTSPCSEDLLRTAVFSVTFAKLKYNDLASSADTKSLCSCFGAERKNVKCVGWSKPCKGPCLTPCLQSLPSQVPQTGEWDKRQIQAEKSSKYRAECETHDQRHSGSFLNKSLEQKRGIMNTEFSLEFGS